ncbi:ATP-binding cassette domain-containing protein [Plantactinospora sp. B6F1]|uniref:ATP-binding cassette domain-containing protein n=1 Tax=Plantactinospora sp. B6F1 TaxID=3158971 RepID=UPI0032D93E1F
MNRVAHRAAAGLAAVRDRHRALGYLTSTGWRPTSAAVGYLLLRATAPAAFAVTAGVFVDRIVRTPGDRLDAGDLMVVLAVLAGLFTIQELSTAMHAPLRQLIVGEVNAVMRQRAMAAALRGGRTEFLVEAETRAWLGELGALTQQSGTPGAAAAGVVFVLAEYLTAFLAVALLATFSWSLAGLLLAAGLCVRFTFRSRCMALAAASMEGAGERTVARYYAAVAQDLGYAKEVRLFGLGTWLADRFDDSAQAGVAPLRLERRRLAVPRVAAVYGLGFVAAAVALALLARAGAQGQLSIGRLAMLITACFLALGIGRFFEAWDFDIEFGTRLVPVLEALERRTATADRADSGGAGPGVAVGAGPPDLPGTPGVGGALVTTGASPVESDGTPENRPHGVRLVDVGFGYPGSAGAVLDGVNLDIPYGHSLAIVGSNGAGKTTLAKLLCGLYRPVRGQILLDGAARPDAAEDLRRHTSAIFQSFLRYRATAAENIAFGAVEHLADRAGVTSAAQRAGVLDALRALPHGLDTVLSADHPGGADLSGGQWQRVALARALFAVDHGARMLILDEPTASLDVPGETEFFELFLMLAGHTTPVLISHRLSTVRHAERIVVLDEGRIVEAGSHEELMTDDTRYRRMFRLQASYFHTPAGATDGGAR